MKKFFGRDKPKPAKPVQGSRETAGIVSPPAEENHFFHHHASHPERTTIRNSSDDHWDLVSTHDGTSPVNSVPRATSPLGPPPIPHHKAPSVKDRDRESHTLRKKPPSTPSAVGVEKILDGLGPRLEVPLQTKEQYDDTPSEYSFREEKKEKKGFWERARDRERNREKERKDEESHAEITRMIGYLTATASEDWSLVLEVCERASVNEVNAKEAVKALRREFKYAEPAAQLSAARLWAIMLRNCKETFIVQCSSRKFLDTLEDVLQSPRTSPVVRERLLDVLAGAAYASPPNTRHDHQGFRSLWRKVKPPEKPEEGIPFDTEDAMFNPPVSAYPQQHPAKVEHLSSHPTRPAPKQKPSSRNRVIPPEEDMRRLFQECKVGRGNAALLSEALAFSKPEDLKQKDIIKEFYARCRASQELIYAQIPWASAGAERSRQAASNKGAPGQTKGALSNNESNGAKLGPPKEDDDTPVELTPEESLLAALLGANEDLMEALRLYDDLERVGIERDAEERSKKETRIDRTRLYQDSDGNTLLEPPPHIYGVGAGASSHSASPTSSPSPSPAPSVAAPSASLGHNNPFAAPYPMSTASSQYHGHASTPTLAPPPPAPHGPRLPTHLPRSRTPSPDRSSVPYSHKITPYDGQYDGNLHYPMQKLQIDEQERLEGETDGPVRPSAKALGKRKLVEPDDAFDPNDMFYEHPNDSTRSSELEDNDSLDGASQRWHQPVHYVYDAAAERMKERINAGRATSLVDEVY